MAEPLIALLPAVIWAFSPIYYKVFLGKFDFLRLNFVRTATASFVLVAPAFYFGFGTGVGYALMSGAVTLACGDSLFLLSIRETGASVASPVVYSYVLMVQLTASSVGEVVPMANLASAALVIVGVFILSRGGAGQPRAKGVAFALAAAVLWTIGQDLILVSVNSGGSIASVTFARNAAAAAALGVAVVLTGRLRSWPRFPLRQWGLLAAVIVSDLVVGSFLLVYSISLNGLGLTIILTSLSPLLTQVFARAMGKERPTGMDFLGGLLIVAALALAVGFATGW